MSLAQLSTCLLTVQIFVPLSWLTLLFRGRPFCLSPNRYSRPYNCFISPGPTWVSCYPSRSMSYLLIFNCLLCFREVTLCNFAFGNRFSGITCFWAVLIIVNLFTFPTSLSLKTISRWIPGQLVLVNFPNLILFQEPSNGLLYN